MADDNIERPQQPNEMRIINEWLGSLLMGETENSQVLISKVQDDGTMRSWSLQVGKDGDGVERVFRVDDEGRQENVLILTDDDGNKIPIAGTQEGVLRVDLSGSVKREEISLMREVLNELRLHRMYWMEMTEERFRLEDLGELEVK